MKQHLKDYSIIIAIDFGTTRSGFAYAFCDDCVVKDWNYWPRQSVPYVKTPTELLLDPAQQSEWGWSARWKYFQLRDEQHPEINKYAYFKWFKLDLKKDAHEHTSAPTTKYRNREFPTIELIANYLKKMREYAISNIYQDRTLLTSEKRILWCITVPAIWNDVNKQNMRDAAIMAGLISQHDDDHQRLIFALEPEAAAVYCRNTSGGSVLFNIGQTFTVVDAGGGTIDLTSYQITHEKKLKQIGCDGGKHGSTFVDRRFLEHLRSVFSMDVLSCFEREHAVEFAKLEESWENAKCTVGSGQRRRWRRG